MVKHPARWTRPLISQAATSQPVRPRLSLRSPGTRQWRAVAFAACLAAAGVSTSGPAIARGPAPGQARPRGTPTNETAVPRSMIAISPGQDIQANVQSAPPRSTFLLKAGVHRLQTVRPKDGDTFTGEPGAVLSGARVLTGFSRSGALWVLGSQTQQGVRHGDCQPGYPRCSFPEQLFVDDAVLLPVESVAQVRTGTWYFDYAADRVYLADDPTGRRVELSVQPEAIEGTGNDVTITGLIVEKFANLAQHGAISADGTSGWTIARNEVRWNHGVGIRIGERAVVNQNNVHHNGQLGIGGGGADVVVEANEIAYNNVMHFDAGWEAGGTKFVGTVRLTVRGNRVHHNDGPGLWTDIDNLDTVYENNTVEDNARAGIFHEISYAAIIRNNSVRRNGFGFPEWIWGAGILVAASPNVEIYGNIVEGNADGIAGVQQRRGSGTRGRYEISNLWVHDNQVRMAQGWTGLTEDVSDNSYYTSRNNRFDRNHYVITAGAAFTWLGAERSGAEWRNYGQDPNGTFSR